MAKFLIYFCCFLAAVSAMIMVKPPQEQCDDDGNGGEQEENKGCEKGWKRFERPSGGWCIKIFYEDSIKQPAAEQKCQAVGATLSGLQNQVESLWAAYTVTQHIAPATGSIWIGLKRREPCLKVGRTANCTAFTSFEWTDKSANGTDGLLWSCNQPDNAWSRTQECAVLLAGSTGYAIGWQVATLDDVGCEFDFVEQNRHPRDPKAYLCGKKPTN
ncbi:hypothetical protein CAEBREN_06555 [Caenorhabditis brenneri]|uniref:C-type lectin domain-containing protein n=1 Tax=Caenorhabditis brenneri TaxID=135651 RepID=G0NQL6_CAEBE|nr:hypothetical protein CAEBREN_06555 [Caenorhabditis brenneri]